MGRASRDPDVCREDPSRPRENPSHRLRDTGPLSLLAEHESPFRGENGALGTNVRVAQDSLRSIRMRLDSGIGARYRLPENRLDHFFSERDEGAAQTELHVPVAATELRS